MAVEPTALLGENGGEIHAEFFGIDNLLGQIERWLDAAPSGLSDEAKAAFVYWRAFSYKVQESADHAARRDTDDVMSRQWTSDQRDDWRKLRDYWQSRYETLRSGEDIDATPRRRSQSIRTSTSWV